MFTCIYQITWLLQFRKAQ